MATLTTQKGKLGDIVYCIKNCTDEGDGNDKFYKGESYKITHWWSDNTFGTSYSKFIVKKKYFSLDKPSDIINNYEIF